MGNRETKNEDVSGDNIRINPVERLKDNLKNLGLVYLIFFIGAIIGFYHILKYNFPKSKYIPLLTTLIVVFMLINYMTIKSKLKETPEKVEEKVEEKENIVENFKKSYKSPTTALRFDNSMYQYSNPPPNMEKRYYDCLKYECHNDDDNYECTERCRYLRTFRPRIKGFVGATNVAEEIDRVEDTADWVCRNFRQDKDAYYKCLDNVYANYRYP